MPRTKINSNPWDKTESCDTGYIFCCNSIRTWLQNFCINNNIRNRRIHFNYRIKNTNLAQKLFLAYISILTQFFILRQFLSSRIFTNSFCFCANANTNIVSCFIKKWGVEVEKNKLQKFLLMTIWKNRYRSTVKNNDSNNYKIWLWYHRPKKR